jgi:dTDP-glucose 4,6-dehydratase
MSGAARILVTGGAGFIGSAVVRQLIAETDARVLTLDRLTYAGHLANLGDARRNPRHGFVRADIADAGAVHAALADFRPTAIMHLAAESHVDRSISGPSEFVTTNIVGTYTLLEQCLGYWRSLPADEAARFRFLHVSTDEVYGALGPEGSFSERSQYQPNSPYSASKAAADHLVRAWHHTYGFPTVTTNCSNNYGPYQFPEKLIPLMIRNALAGKPLPVYGAGDQVRDWLYVDDHARALRLVLERGRLGEVYCIGGAAERVNLDVVHALCDRLDALRPGPHSYRTLIRHVTDRPGHDKRYAMDFSKLTAELGWTPREDFASGLAKTAAWYVENEEWCRLVVDDASRGLTETAA